MVKIPKSLQLAGEGATTGPVVFISYSWSSEEHKEVVRKFADKLLANGVQVIIDTYDAQPGQDLLHFMEQSVTRDDVTNVLVIADKTYAEKADKRTGGVGTETQLLSKEVYEKVDQIKIVPLIFEKDEDNKPHVPTYMKTRFHIDFSDPDKIEESFEELLRHLFKKPQHKKPALGAPPDFAGQLQVPASQAVLTKSLARSALSSREAYESLISQLEEYRQPVQGDHFQDEVVLDRLAKTKNIRDVVIGQLESEIAKIEDKKQVSEFVNNVEYLLTRLKEYTYPPAGVNAWRDSDYDHFGFMLNELILYVIALLIKYRKFSVIPKIQNKTYFYNTNTGESEYEEGIEGFRTYQQSLDQYRNARLELNRVSVSADLLRERADLETITFDDLNSADSILYLLTQFAHPENRRRWWFPRLSIFSRRIMSLAPLSQMVSKERAEQAIAMFGYADIEAFKQALEEKIKVIASQQPIIDSFNYNPPSLGKSIPKDIGKVA